MKLAPALVLILLLPIASALTVVSIQSEDYVKIHYPVIPGQAIFSDTYSVLLGSRFNATNLYRANLRFAFDFGQIGRSTSVQSNTNWTVSGTNILIKNYAVCPFLGDCVGSQEPFVNGTRTLKFERLYPLTIISSFSYQPENMLQYAENVSADVPTISGNQVWTWNGATSSTHVDNVSGLFYIRDDVTETFFAHNNATKPSDINFQRLQGRVWLSNMTHPTSWSVGTEYLTFTPAVLDVTEEFETQQNFLSDASAESAGACSGVAAIFESLIGTCPSLTGIARWAIGLIPNILAFFLDFIHPAAGEALRFVGQLAGEFVATYIFVLQLILVSPGNFFLVLVASGSGFILLGASRGTSPDPIGDIIRKHGTLLKSIAIAGFWYFYIYYLLGKWIWELIIKIVDTIGGFVPFT